MGRIHLLDYDAVDRVANLTLLEKVGHVVTAYDLVDDFLRADLGDAPQCLIVDLLTPGLNGLQVCREIASRQIPCSFVITSSLSDVTSAVEAMRIGAVDFLEKPCRGPRLLEAVDRAIAAAQARHDELLRQRDMRGRIALLSSRERVVLDAIAEGLPTKSIAKRLEISTRTVDVHRSRIMQKLDVGSP